MEGEEFDALVADIKANGLHYPIILYDGMILDGRNRYRACLQVGFEPAVRNGDHWIGDPAAFVISRNIRRRHLTADQKRDLIAKVIKAAPEKSNRQIAAETGVSHTHVNKVRAEMEEAGDVETVSTSIDTKGRKQPARKEKQPKPADQATRGPDNAPDAETAAKRRKAEHAAVDAEPGAPRRGADEAARAPAADPVTAALAMVERMSEEEREDLFEELQGSYDWDVLYEDDSDQQVVRAIVSAIGAERARALAKKMDGLITKVAGLPPLSDCPMCEGRGSVDYEVSGFFGNGKVTSPCRCVRRKPKDDLDALRAALQREREGRPAQDFSFGVEATTKDGRVWASGVRLATKEEAELYVEGYARRDLKPHGYATEGDAIAFDVKRYDEPPVMSITGKRRKTLNFPHGTCGLMRWRPIAGGECECEKCKEEREFLKQNEFVERARAAGEISQEQYDEWNNSTAADPDPEWLVRLLAAERAAARQDALAGDHRGERHQDREAEGRKAEGSARRARRPRHSRMPAT
jgi:hypothetical protein